MLHLKLHKAHFASVAIILLLPFALFAQAKPAHKAGKVTKKSDQAKVKVNREEQNNYFYCKALPAEDIQKPKITVNEIKQSSSLQGGKYKVKGVIDGICLKEAGLYENGERILKFPLRTSPYYTRVDFQFEVNYDNKPEIRAFDINWQRSSEMLLKTLKRKNS